MKNGSEQAGWLVASGAICLAGAVSGCAGPGLSTGFDAPDGGARLHAVERAAEEGDTKAIPNLVALLRSEDPAVRMLSIRTLERMTGQTLQYEHSAPLREREEAVLRWEAWLAAQGLKASPMPADGDLHPAGSQGVSPGSSDRPSLSEQR